ncbi:uncharacterized protein LOC134635628 [Pelmatolapia mariae]|uniref:uncharacterized protein LOC134635628 n=1 Tax=Pelmatolapia mariae TaxID=158779 RepID=UPI002FE532C2
MTTKKLLIETLNQLSPEDFAEFKSLTEGKKHLSSKQRRRLKTANTQDVVKLMMETYRGECVEETRKALMKMNRTDLVQRLSDKQFPPLSQRVETMESLIELLLETLADLSDSELENFQQVLRRKHVLSSLFMETETDLQDVVFLMVRTFGQQSVEEIVEVLKEMKRTDLAQRLTDSSSEAQNKHLDEHLSALIHKVATMAAVTDLLPETLEDLSEQEFNEFLWFLQFTRFQKSLPEIEMSNDRGRTVVVMIDKWGHQSVEVTREFLTDMQRTDLVQRLSESSSGLKAAGSSAEGFDVEETEKEKHSEDERWPALIHKVETMESVIELLLETLDGLNEVELRKFNWTLEQILDHDDCDGMNLSLLLYLMSGLLNTVFLMVLTYGQQSVEKTMEVLEEIRRTDLAQRLSDCSSLPRKKHSVDERRSALIHKMATFTAVKHLLLEHLNDLNNDEYRTFKKLLLMIHPWMDPWMDGSSFLSPSPSKTVFVNLMMGKLGQQSVEVTREVFMRMNRTDLVQKLSESSSASREKHSVDEHGAALLKRGKALEAVRQILLETLNEFSQKDLGKFILLLPFTCFKMGLPQIEMYKNRTEDLVDLMVDELGHQSVEVTMEVLTDMNRPDLMLRLSESSSGRKTERSSELEGCQSMTQDTSDWTKLEPEVNSTDADEAPTYSLQSAAGHFECRVSGLRWVCKGKTSFQYQFRSWEGHMERMEGRQYMPAGPLMDVTVTAGKLNEVHLPHWICIDDIPDILDMFAVVHIDDCGDVVEKVSEVTPSHVKLTEPHFSLIGALIRLFFPVKISCYTLMYYKTNTSFLKLHVYPIRQDPALEQGIDKEESSDGYKRIKKPHPDKYLQTERTFSLRADMETAEIQPQELTFRYNRINFYEVFIENPDRKLRLTLLHSNDDEPVWTCNVHQGDFPMSGYVGASGSSKGATGVSTSAAGSSRGAAGVGTLAAEQHSVDKHPPARGKKALFKSDRKRYDEDPEEEEEHKKLKLQWDSDAAAQMPKALTDQSDREKLLGMLEDLKKEELEKFKFFLRDRDVLVELQPIPESQLEKASTCDLVDLMLQTYTEKSVEVTKKVLKKINRNDLVQKLSDSSS